MCLRLWDCSRRSPICACPTCCPRVRRSTIIPVIDGPGFVARNQLFALNASRSIDPDKEPDADLTFAWTCQMLNETSPAGVAGGSGSNSTNAAVLGGGVISTRNGDGSSSRNVTSPCLGASGMEVKFDRALPALQVALGLPGRYLFTVWVAQSTTRPPVRATKLVLVDRFAAPLPLVSIEQPSVILGALVSPSDPITLVGHVNGTGNVTLTWSLVNASDPANPSDWSNTMAEANISSPSVLSRVAVSPTTASPVFVFKSGGLKPNHTYTLMLTAKDNKVGSAAASRGGTGPAFSGHGEPARHSSRYERPPVRV